MDEVVERQGRVLPEIGAEGAQEESRSDSEGGEGGDNLSHGTAQEVDEGRLDWNPHKGEDSQREKVRKMFQREGRHQLA